MNSDCQRENKMSLEDIKKTELGILDFIDNICRDYNITYYLCYGTLIGAIRHKGFIPWDDDIDIAMPRKDYERFIDIMQTLHITPKYKLHVPLEDGYYYEFAKVVDTDTQIESDKDTFACAESLWVDIFPLDGLVKEDRCTHWKIYYTHLCRVAAVYKTFPHKTKGFKVPFEYIFWKVCKTIGYKYFLKKLLKLSLKYRFEDCDTIGFAAAFPGKTKYMSKEWFGEPVKVEFEGNMYNAPSKYQEYLSTQYGDYMSLPPKEKRITHLINAYKKYHD